MGRDQMIGINVTKEEKRKAKARASKAGFGDNLAEFGRRRLLEGELKLGEYKHTGEKTDQLLRAKEIEAWFKAQKGNLPDMSLERLGDTLSEAKERINELETGLKELRSLRTEEADTDSEFSPRVLELDNQYAVVSSILNRVKEINRDLQRAEAGVTKEEIEKAKKEYQISNQKLFTVCRNLEKKASNKKSEKKYKGLEDIANEALELHEKIVKLAEEIPGLTRQPLDKRHYYFWCRSNELYPLLGEDFNEEDYRARKLQNNRRLFAAKPGEVYWVFFPKCRPDEAILIRKTWYNTTESQKQKKMLEKRNKSSKAKAKDFIKDPFADLKN